MKSVKFRSSAGRTMAVALIEDVVPIRCRLGPTRFRYFVNEVSVDPILVCRLSQVPMSIPTRVMVLNEVR